MFKIVAFGDSIMQGKNAIQEEEHFLRLLSNKMGPNFEFINAGVGGNSAREAMERYERDVLSHDPDLIILEFGGNNTDRRPGREHRTVPVEEFRMHLENFKKGVPEGCKVIVMTFPPVINERYQACRTTPVGDVDGGIEKFRVITREFAAQNSYPLLDMYKLMYERRHELILPDGVHHNAAGHAFMAEKIYEALKDCLDL